MSWRVTEEIAGGPVFSPFAMEWATEHPFLVLFLAMAVCSLISAFLRRWREDRHGGAFLGMVRARLALECLDKERPAPGAISRALSSVGLRNVFHDVRTFTPKPGELLADFPADVRATVSSCMDSGDFRGANFADVASGRYPIEPGLTLWLALSDQDGAPSITAFVSGEFKD
jgi:hypothetical protein